jgi:heme-degrading monooxygenase HmoA
VTVGRAKEVVRVVLQIRVRPGREEEFDDAWGEIAEKAREVPGNRRQTLLRDRDDPATHVITSEWESREDFHRFEASREQDDLIAPLRALRVSAKQSVFDVVADVSASRHASPGDGRGKGRVVFIVRVKPGMEEAFLKAYESIRYEVAQGVKGHIVDQVCQSPEDPDRWVITSEWESLDDFYAWESTEEHRDLAAPMRECMAEAQSLKFVVREETSAGQEAANGARG